MDDLALLRGGIAAAGHVLRSVYKIDANGTLDPLNPKDFQIITAKLAAELKGHAVPVEAKALQKAVEALDVDWFGLNKEARGKVVSLAQSYLGEVPKKVLPKIDQTLAYYGHDITSEAKKNTVIKHELKISPSLNDTDERIAQFTRFSVGHYVRDAYGNRVDSFGATAKEIVAAGLEKGLGSADISAQLQSKLTAAGRSPGYWDMIAMVYANRSRTTVQLCSFGEAGIESYQWESVMDEATSLQCRFMHGRVFSVPGAVNSIHAVEEDGDPEAVKFFQPFLNVSGDKLYLKHGVDGPRHDVATVTESALGQKDKAGKFDEHMSQTKLELLGVRMPPLHGHCRSTVIPVTSASISSPASAPKVPVVAPPKPSAADQKAAALTELGEISNNGLTYSVNLFSGGPSETIDGVMSKLVGSNGFDDPSLFSDFVELNKTSKKPKLDSLTPTVPNMSTLSVESMIKHPKVLSGQAKPLVVKKGGETFIIHGHEQIAAQQLLGQKTAYVDFVDFDKKLVKPDLSKHAIPISPAVAPSAAPSPASTVPTSSPLLTNPKAVVVWDKTPKYEGELLHGVPIAPADEKEWTKLKDVAMSEPKVPDLKPGQKRSSGVVVVEPDGRIWIVEPKDHFGGYEHTFPKGKVDTGLSMQQNALKEAWEESGLDVEITGYLGDFEGTTSNTRYYIAKRRGGAPWKAHWESQAVKLVPVDEAALMLNTKRDKDILAALADHEKKKEDERASKLDASVILGTRVGPQAGSNEGGMFRGTDGVNRYVKFYKNPDQAYGEHIANSLYRDLGHGAPRSTTFEHEGKIAYASDIIADVKTLGSVGLTKDNAQKAMRGFVGDVLTGNWDAAGLSLDNMVIDKSGNVIRIDNGGTFLRRASGALKAPGSDKSILNKLDDWETLFNPSINSSYAKVASAAGYKSALDMRGVVIDEIDKVTALRDANGGWHAYVTKKAPGLKADDQNQIATMLQSRHDLLLQKRAMMLAPTPRDPNAPQVVFNLINDKTATAKKLRGLIDDEKGLSYYTTNVYTPAGIDAKTAREAYDMISGWTGEYRLGSVHKKFYAESAKAMLGGGSDTTIGKMARTRSERWRAVLDAIGEKNTPTPTHFDCFRGMSDKSASGGGTAYIKDVVKAWADDNVTHVKVESHEVASWSWSREKANKFRTDHGVTHRWLIPIEQTVVDQATDDSSFQSVFKEEHEVIAGPGHDKGIDLPKEGAVVAYHGVEYTYADRAKLFAAMARRGDL